MADQTIYKTHPDEIDDMVAGSAKWAAGQNTSLGAGTSGANPDAALPPSYAPNMSWVRVRLEDANVAYFRNRLDECKAAVNLANAMMRYLELEAQR